MIRTIFFNFYILYHTIVHCSFVGLFKLNDFEFVVLIFNLNFYSYTIISIQD